jgi:hypothetical protein
MQHGASSEEVKHEKKKQKVGFVLRPKPEEPGEIPEEKAKKDPELLLRKKNQDKINYLKKLFAKIFKHDEWYCENEGKNFTYTSKKNKHHVIRIEKKKGQITFYGIPIDKVIEAAAEYETATGVQMDYAVEANTLEAAIAFMKSLHENHFDISRIKALELKEKKDYDLEKIIQEIKKQPQHAKEGRSAPTPKLGGKKEKDE